MISFLKQKWRFFLSLLPFKRTRTSTVYSEINRESTPTTRRKHKPRERKKERKRQSRESSLWSYLLTECWDTSIYMFALHEYLSIAAKNWEEEKAKWKCILTSVASIAAAADNKRTVDEWVCRVLQCAWMFPTQMVYILTTFILMIVVCISKWKSQTKLNMLIAAMR